MDVRLNGWMVVLLLGGTMAYAIAEEITLTTYYPSPRGVYQELRTAGDMAIGRLDAPSARLEIVGASDSAGNALQVRSANQNTLLLVQNDGKVGIGTPAAGYKLDVNGTVNATGIRLPTGAANNYVLTSDASGVGTWQTLSTSSQTNLATDITMCIDSCGGAWPNNVGGREVERAAAQVSTYLYARGPGCTGALTGWNANYRWGYICTK